MSENTTHYRLVFKSDHLGQADLEDMLEAGRRLVFTIKHVRQEFDTKVAGKKINANIAYFTDESIKPWVVNATNSAILRRFYGTPFVKDWGELLIELYIDPNVKMKGEITGGVKVSPNKPKVGKPELKPGDNQWDSAIEAYKRDGNLEKVLSRVTISEANQKRIQDAGNIANAS